MISFASLFSAPEATPSYGEPEWMPSPAEVARARADLERRGVVQSLTRDLAGTQMVPAGETPWPWFIGAALWVIIWPAVIALRFGTDRLDWLPWWLPIILAVLHMLVQAGPVMVAVRDSGHDSLRRRFGQVQTVAQMLALDPSEFEAWVGMLFAINGYQVQNTQDTADHGIDLVVTLPQLGTGLVQCKRYRGTVGEPVVRDLYGTLMHERANYGWLATTGGISRQAREWASGKPIDLWDGQKLAEYARKYR
jgi:hypothetical protein